MNAAIYTTTDNKLAYQFNDQRALFSGKGGWEYQAKRADEWVGVKGAWRREALVAKVKAALGK